MYEGVSDDVLTGAEADDPQGSTPRKRIYNCTGGNHSTAAQCIDAFLGIDHTPGAYFPIY